jgi:hypothetical protein
MVAWHYGAVKKKIQKIAKLFKKRGIGDGADGAGILKNSGAWAALD